MPTSPSDCRPPRPTLGEFLRGASWARELSAVEIARVESETRERALLPGTFVSRRGDPPAHWVGVVDGLVKITRSSPGGRTVTFTGIAAGGWVGENALLRNERRRADIVAVRHTRIACMPRETFVRLLDSSLAFNRFLLRQLNERVGQYFGFVESDRVQDSDTRIAHCLAALFDPVLNPGMESELRLSQQEIGSLSGTSRQRTNEALHRLEACGLVRVGYGAVRIVDLEGVRSFGNV